MTLSRDSQIKLFIILQYSSTKHSLITDSSFLLKSQYLNDFESKLREYYYEMHRNELKDSETKKTIDDLIINVGAEEFPKITLNAIFSSSYNLFENRLISISNFLSEHAKLNLRLSDIDGKGFRKVKTFLKKVALVQFENAKELTDRILDYSEMRNILLHRDGQLKNSTVSQKPWVIKDFLSTDKQYLHITTKSIYLSNNDYSEFFQYLSQTFCSDVKS